MQKFSSFGRKKKNRPKFDIEWLCSKTFNCVVGTEQSVRKSVIAGVCFSQTPATLAGEFAPVRISGVSFIATQAY